MCDGNSTVTRIRTTTAFVLLSLLLPALGTGCSFDPLKYFSRNACDMLNCEVLFFVDDVFPLSAAPTAGGSQDAAVEEDAGGHAH